MIIRRKGTFRPQVTRLRVLRRGWGRFTTESVLIAMADPDRPDDPDPSPADLDDILDLDDEDAETGLPYARERPN